MKRVLVATMQGCWIYLRVGLGVDTWKYDEDGRKNVRVVHTKKCFGGGEYRKVVETEE